MNKVIILSIAFLAFFVSFTFAGGVCSGGDGTSCEECLAQTNATCGYCNGALCMTAAEAATECSRDGLDDFLTTCPDPCPYDICTECLETAGCGYCMTIDKCIATSKSDTCGDFRNDIGDSDACTPPEPCSQKTFCSDCIDNPFYTCSWCQGATFVSSSCRERNSTNPCSGSEEEFANECPDSNGACRSALPIF